MINYKIINKINSLIPFGISDLEILHTIIDCTFLHEDRLTFQIIFVELESYQHKFFKI